MKLNRNQKIWLFIHILFVIFISVFHVPVYRGNGYVGYETIFSDNIKINSSMYFTILFIVTLLFFVAYLGINYIFKDIKIDHNILFRQVDFARYKIKKYRGFIISVFAIRLLVFFAKELHKENIERQIRKQQLYDDSVASINRRKSEMLRLENERRLKVIYCNEETALRNFKDYMNFKYPDWKIFDSPAVKLVTDCTYQVRFITLDPSDTYFKEKKVMIAEIYFTPDFKSYYFNMVRGTLH